MFFKEVIQIFEWINNNIIKCFYVINNDRKANQSHCDRNDMDWNGSNKKEESSKCSL